MKKWTRLSPFASRPRAGKPAPPRRLQLEYLEDRCVPAGLYQQVNLFSDVPGLAQNTDPNLINAWGIAVSPFTVWVSSNGGDVSSVYIGGTNGNPWVNTGLVVSIPGGAPTGQVFNPTSDFVVSDGNGHSGKAVFIFASENGTITGWNPFVPPPPPSTQAQLGASVPDAVFKGLALGSNASGNFLFATDFHHNQIDVFDKNYNLVSLAPGAFQDPNLPQHYAPFGIQNINGKLYVTYALQDMDQRDDVRGLGHGFIDVYDTGGTLLQRLVSRGALNSPWGLALAPSDFGQFSNDLLVSNFGSGLISAFDPNTGAFQGFLQTKNGGLLAIDGLWGIAFGNGTSAGQTNQLLFSAGPKDEEHGLFGFIQVDDSSANLAGGNQAVAGAAPGQILRTELIRDGRPVLPAPTNPVGGAAARPVGVSTGGHSTPTAVNSEGTRPSTPTVTVAHAHGDADALRRAIDALFAALRPGDNPFEGR